MPIKMTTFTIDSLGLPGTLTFIIGIVALILFVLWRLLLAYLVMNDADRLFKANRLFLNSNGVWIIATLFMGSIAVLVYWVLHYSVLLARVDPSGR